MFLRLIGLVLLITTNSLFAASAEDYQDALKIWGKVLNENVDKHGRVNFKNILIYPNDLESVIRVIKSYGPTSSPGDFINDQQLLAYHINTYNALAMYGVIERGIPKGFTNPFSRASFFKFRSIIIDGEKTSLHRYENKVIRPIGEARTHFALNCMVRDCPRLPQKPFTAADLEAELQAAAMEFFRKPRHLRMDHEKKRIYVSSILKFYTEDFVESGNKNDLPSYINSFLEQPLPTDYELRYIDYDWHINRQVNQPNNEGSGP